MSLPSKNRIAHRSPYSNRSKPFDEDAKNITAAYSPVNIDCKVNSKWALQLLRSDVHRHSPLRVQASLPPCKRQGAP
jgi:hypothetical protein